MKWESGKSNLTPVGYHSLGRTYPRSIKREYLLRRKIRRAPLKSFRPLVKLSCNISGQSGLNVNLYIDKTLFCRVVTNTRFNTNLPISSNLRLNIVGTSNVPIHFVNLNFLNIGIVNSSNITITLSRIISYEYKTEGSSNVQLSSVLIRQLDCHISSSSSMSTNLKVDHALSINISGQGHFIPEISLQRIRAFSHPFPFIFNSGAAHHIGVQKLLDCNIRGHSNLSIPNLVVNNIFFLLGINSRSNLNCSLFKIISLNCQITSNSNLSVNLVKTTQLNCNIGSQSGFQCNLGIIEKLRIGIVGQSIYLINIVNNAVLSCDINIDSFFSCFIKKVTQVDCSFTSTSNLNCSFTKTSGLSASINGISSVNSSLLMDRSLRIGCNSQSTFTGRMSNFQPMNLMIDGLSNILPSLDVSLDSNDLDIIIGGVSSVDIRMTRFSNSSDRRIFRATRHLLQTLNRTNKIQLS